MTKKIIKKSLRALFDATEIVGKEYIRNLEWDENLQKYEDYSGYESILVKPARPVSGRRMKALLRGALYRSFAENGMESYYDSLWNFCDRPTFNPDRKYIIVAEEEAGTGKFWLYVNRVGGES